MSEYLNNIVYGVKSFLTGMKLTMDHFRNKKELVVTLQYPHEKWPIPERNIGFNHSEYNLIRSRLHVDIDDCIACMQCEKACPVDCIKIDSIKPPKGSEIDCGMTSNDTQKKMIVSRFTIDMSECMYCNLCVYPCPEECIYMVGGPNAEKHEIDYEFSQYKRDGMIFEFADATDDMIRDAGGDKWLERRDAKLKKNSEGVELMGIVPEAITTPVVATAVEIKTETAKPAAAEKSIGGELEIKSFNDIADKMCRGIAKKAFMAAKRAGKDTTAILADVAQALSDAGKMTEDIQSILDGLSAPSPEAVTPVVETEGATKAESVAEVPPTTEVKEFDIKDLNVIEDKMARGTAKKAFLAAKRSGEDKVEAVRKALGDAGKLDVAAEKLLNSFTSAAAEPSQPTAVEKTAEPTEEAAAESPAASEPAEDLPLFEIAEL
nr:4Fe-4S binding protein [Candidatus Neomarinimicrobiota bacterium]